jgi:hypothetical protein
MRLFERTYKKILNLTSAILENFDSTKETYGYSLKTYAPEEIELFEAFADAVISAANRNKASLASGSKRTNVMWLNGVQEDVRYNKLKKSICSKQNKAWTNFYAPAVIHVGVPSLSHNNGEFYLDFANHLPLVDRRVPESKNWKKHIIAALKFSLTDKFYDYLDSIDPKRHSLSPEVKDFFDWRENEIKLKELTKKLPELEGVF